MRPILILWLLLWATPALARCDGPGFLDMLTAQDRARVDKAVAQTPHATGLIWEARREGARIVIIGTMHIADPRLAPLRAALESDVQDADVLLVEAGPAEEAEMTAAIASDPSLIFITDGATLPERLSPADWTAISDATRARQIPPFLAAKMQPWYLSLNLALPPCAMQEIKQGARGLDHLLMKDAAAADVPIAALEPWDTLFALMRDVPPDEQLALLRLSLLAPDLQTALHVTTLNAYFAGEVARIWEVSRLAAHYVPEIDADRAATLFAVSEAGLLTARNKAWMPRIADAAAAHDRIVIAVGAAHLPGESGVLNLLAQDGWTITARPMP